MFLFLQSGGSSKTELMSAKFNDHPAKHYIPINVSPLGTDALFIGARLQHTLPSLPAHIPRTSIHHTPLTRMSIQERVTERVCR